jgi:hypothetical protein
MRRAIALTLLLVALGAVIVAARIDPSPRGTQPFVVHEWGTFTSFAGADGVELEFRPLVDNDLPDFVFDRARQAGYQYVPYLKSGWISLQRMETPVTYFYTDRPREVQVAVGFPQGLLTEFFPPVKQQSPAFKPGARPEPKNGRLDWGTLRLIPEKQFAKLQAATAAQGQKPPALSTVKGENHYEFARETDSAIVETDGHLAAPGKQYEKFLFYRGIGNFQLPLKLTAGLDGKFELTNNGSELVRSLFLVNVDHRDVRFTQYAKVDAGGKLLMELSPETKTVDDLSEAVVGELVAAGLYEKEARSMVKTWRTSWFNEPGTRLFYILPPRLVDAMLPLQVQPQPDDVVRVMVGRLEILTPQHERQLTDLLRATASVEQRGGALAAAQQFLKPLGRFAEPALTRIAKTTNDPRVVAGAHQLLNHLSFASRRPSDAR